MSGLSRPIVSYLRDKYLHSILVHQESGKFEPGSAESREAAVKWADVSGHAHSKLTELVLEKISQKGSSLTPKEIAELTSSLTALTRSCLDLLDKTGGLG